MSVTVALFRPRVRIQLQAMDGKYPIDVILMDQAIRNEYISMNQRLPRYESYTAAAGTISAASDSFTLPTTAGAEYGPNIRVQLVNTGMWLEKVSPDEMEALRNGQTAADPGGDPTCFAPYENSSQSIVCDVFPRNRTAQTYNLRRSSVTPDFSTTDIDGHTLALGVEGQEALMWKVCAALLMMMDTPDVARRRLNQQVAAEWDRKGERSIYLEGMKRHNIMAIGRHQRFVA